MEKESWPESPNSTHPCLTFLFRIFSLLVVVTQVTIFLSTNYLPGLVCNYLPGKALYVHDLIQSS